jgi:cob(I)alamin adenosyltransferase
MGGVMMPRLKQGLVQVYTGDGKGKTSAAIGAAVRALGHGLRVCLIQFLKGAEDSGELKVLRDLANVTLRQFGTDWRELARRNPAWWTVAPTEQERQLIQEGLRFAGQIISSGEHDLVILDEINVACAQGLIAAEDILALVTNRPSHVELILTGRGAPPALCEAADLVTEMKEVKHPLARPDSIGARRGVEF